jgi:hypothetical protein
MSKRFALGLLVPSLLLATYSSTPVQADEPFKLNASEQRRIEQPPPGIEPTYQKPQMIYDTPKADVVPPPPPPRKGNVHAQPSRPMQPLTAGIAVTKQLPPEFLGVWRVMGNRKSIDALPQYQAGVQNIFSGTTSNTWTIAGSPQQGYSLTSDTGVTTQLAVDKVQGGTAFLRYQHQIRNTMAQEAVVMELGPNGATFQGLERISVVKPGEPQPRCKVTYELAGQRQR